MCRFIAVKFQKNTKPKKLLAKFAQMAEESRTLDGDEQKDGWGIAWLDEKQQWRRYRSLEPIWETSQTDKFIEFPDTKIFIAHVRSATFKSQLDNIEFNQPYISKKFAFAFNGHLEGVELNRPVKGKIGAEKVWNLTQEFLQKKPPQQALMELRDTIKKSTKKIHGMNIVLADKQNIYDLCEYTPNDINPDYYRLHTYIGKSIKIIASESLAGYDTKMLKSGELEV